MLNAVNSPKHIVGKTLFNPFDLFGIISFEYVDNSSKNAAENISCSKLVMLFVCCHCRHI